MTTERRQWEGEVELGGFGVRVGGDDLRLDELLRAGENVRVTVEWPDRGEPLQRIMAPSFGTLPSRHQPEADADDSEDGGDGDGDKVEEA